MSKIFSGFPAYSRAYVRHTVTPLLPSEKEFYVDVRAWAVKKNYSKNWPGRCPPLFVGTGDALILYREQGQGPLDNHNEEDEADKDFSIVHRQAD